MIKFLVLFVAIAITSCGKTTSTKPIDVPAEIAQRAELYKELIHVTQGTSGFIDLDKCDSVLFSSLIATAGVPVNVQAAELEPGRWLRRPVSEPECKATGASRSTISRDMLLGVMFYAYFTGNLDILEDLWEYGSSNLWVMGEGDGSQIMNPDYIALLAKLSYKLGGPDRLIRNTPLSIGKGCDNFRCHLAVMFLLLMGEADGGLSDADVDTLREISEKNPQNAFYTAAARKYGVDRPWDIDWKLFPRDRLPTTDDRCSRWVTERNDGDRAFAPCPDQGHTHSGGELIVVDWLLRR